MSSILTATNCIMCQGESYFGDFGPGLYPLPCPQCAGTGLEGIVSEEVKTKITSLREELYTRIRAQTERLGVAAEGFRMGILATTSQLLGKPDWKEYEEQRQKIVHKLGTFPVEYFPVEAECLREGWEHAAQLVDPRYQVLIQQNSTKVVGKTYEQNARMELEHYRRKMRPNDN